MVVEKASFIESLITQLLTYAGWFFKNIPRNGGYNILSSSHVV